MFAIDHQRGLREQIRPFVSKVDRVRRSDMVARGANKDHVAAPFLFGDLRKVLGECQHRRETGRVVERGIEPSIHMSHDEDVFVSRAGERPVDAHRFQVWTRFRLELQLELHRAGADQIAELLAILKSQKESRYESVRGEATAQPLPGRHVVVVAPDGDDRCRAGIVGSFEGGLEESRLPHLPRREHGVNDCSLAAYVPSREVGGRSETDPHGIQVETAGRRGRGAERRPRSTERQGLAAAGGGHVPVGREPLRRQRELGTVDIHHAELAEPRFEQIGRHRLVLRARDAAPVLVSVVAALARDGDDLVDDRLHVQAVDVGVRAFGVWQR